MTAKIVPYHLREFVRQSSLRMLSTTGRIVTSLPTHISQIFGLCAEKQVGGIHATWVVAAMADHVPIRNRADGQRVTHAMSKLRKATLITDPAVATLLLGCQPRPTLVWPAHIDLLPESLGQWAWPA